MDETAGDETAGDESTETSFDPATFAVDVTVCEDPARATALIDGPVTIGTSVPLSGGPAVLFAPFADGMRAYVDYYNAEFGGVNGHDIELVIKDDQYAADLTSANVEQLIYDEDVDILAGVLGSPNNMAIRDLANDLCVPQLWAATGDSDWGHIDEYPWTTGLLAAYEIETAIWADFVAAELGEGSTLGLFYVNNEFGQAYAAAMTALADELGIEIVATEVIDPMSSGAPSAQMTNLVAADPDAVLAVPLGAQCIAFMTELENAKAANSGFDPLVYMTATCADEIVFGAVQNGGAEGVYTSANIKDVTNPDVVASDDAVVAYLDAFAASGSSAAPGGLASMGWTAAELAVWSIEQAEAEGNLSREGIMNAARNIDYQAALLRDGLTFKMDANDGYIGEGAQIVQWQDGGFVDVGDVVDLEGTLGVGSSI
ncbi:MAG: ABC transporter substrate-binding protein [Actinomycetota bacterium]